MTWKRHLAEAATLVAAAVVCALVANGLAARERKIAVVGNYVNATTVPKHDTAPPAPIVTDSATVPAMATAAPTPATQTTATAAIETVGLNPNAANPAKAAPAPPTTAAATTTTTTKGTPKPPTAASPAASSDSVLAHFTPHPDKPYIEIHGDDVTKLHAAGALFLDARRTSIYEQGHVAGARPFSVWESDIDAKVNKLFEERSDPRQQALPIVVYCTGGDCEDSHMLAEKLWGIQFNNVYVYKDGFPDWQKRGGAIEEGERP